MKAGKEEIMGLLAAVEQWVRRDLEAEWQEWERRLQVIADAVTGLDSVTTSTRTPRPSNVAPHMTIKWDAQKLGVTAAQVRQQLSAGEPRIESTGGEEGPIGTYRSTAHLTALTFTARFGQGAKTCGCAAKHKHGKHVAAPPPPVDDPGSARPADDPATRPVRPAPPVKERPRATPPAKRKTGLSGKGTATPAAKRPARPAAPAR